MRHGSARVAVLLCGALAVTPTALLAGPESPSPELPGAVACRDGRVTLHVTKAPLADVVGRVAAQCGVTQYGTVEGSATTDMAFDEVPVAEAFERLLGTGNFTLRYRDDQVVGIRVLWTSAAASSPAAPAGAPRAATAPAMEPAGTEKAPTAAGAGWRQEIPVDRKLGLVLGKDRIPAQTLLQAAFTHRRPIVRRRAMRTLLRNAEQQPEIRALFSDYEKLDPSAVATMARQGMGKDADRSLRLAFSSLTDPQLREQMLQVLGELRATRSSAP
jgi:hypothetical protein